MKLGYKARNCALGLGPTPSDPIVDNPECIHLNLCPTGQNQKRNSKNFQKLPRNQFFKQSNLAITKILAQLARIKREIQKISKNGREINFFLNRTWRSQKFFVITKMSAIFSKLNVLSSSFLQTSLFL